MLDFHMLHRKGNPRQLKERYFLPNCSNNSGGGVNQTLFIRGCAILALNIAPINPAALPKNDTHKSGKQEPRKALTTVSSMSKAGKIILRQFFSKVYP